MKNQTLLTLIFASIFGFNSFAQDIIRQKPCTLESILLQADSIKSYLSTQGFVVEKEASVSMESEYEMPVIVPLNQGSWYQFIFIGDYSSRLYEVRMYDWQERMVVFRQNRWGDVDGNVISYTYVPKFSEFHMMKPVQVNKQKKKNLCGYVMLFKRTAEEINTGAVNPVAVAPVAKGVE